MCEKPWDREMNNEKLENTVLYVTSRHVRREGKWILESFASVFIIYVDISQLNLPFRRKRHHSTTIMQPFPS